MERLHPHFFPSIFRFWIGWLSLRCADRHVGKRRFARTHRGILRATDHFRAGSLVDLDIEPKGLSQDTLLKSDSVCLFSFYGTIYIYIYAWNLTEPILDVNRIRRWNLWALLQVSITESAKFTILSWSIKSPPDFQLCKIATFHGTFHGVFLGGRWRAGRLAEGLQRRDADFIARNLGGCRLLGGSEYPHGCQNKESWATHGLLQKAAPVVFKSAPNHVKR